MKKNIMFSAILSLILTIIGFLINLIGSLAFESAPLTRTIHGGEIIEHIGFGINFSQIYIMSSHPGGGGVSRLVKFDPSSFIFSIIIIFLIILLIKTLISNKRIKENSENENH